MSEDMSEQDVIKYARKGCQKICPKKCQKKCQIERLYWTASIELQAPKRPKSDVATTILA